MTVRHGLDGVADELATGQRVLHAVVPHSDAVADADGRELDGRAAGRRYPQLDGLRDFPQMHMPGDNLVKSVDYADERLLQILITVPHGMEQRPVRRAGNALLDYIATHKQALLNKIQYTITL